MFAVLILTAACASHAPPEGYVSPADLGQFKNLRPIFFKEQNLVLHVPKRWIVKKYEFRDYNNDTTRVLFQDLGGRNAHGIIWILDDPGGFFTNYALGTMRNKTNSYNYTSQVLKQKPAVVHVDGHPILGWRAKVTVLGNFRDMALFYEKRSVPGQPDKWLMVFIRNEGSHKNLDIEKDIKDIVVPIFASFLVETKDGTFKVE